MALAGTLSFSASFGLSGSRLGWIGGGDGLKLVGSKTPSEHQTRTRLTPTLSVKAVGLALNAALTSATVRPGLDAHLHAREAVRPGLLEGVACDARDVRDVLGRGDGLELERPRWLADRAVHPGEVVAEEGDFFSPVFAFRRTPWSTSWPAACRSSASRRPWTGYRCS